MQLRNVQFTSNMTSNFVEPMVSQRHLPLQSVGRRRGYERKKLAPNCFHHRALCYGGQVILTKLDYVETLRSKKATKERREYAKPPKSR